MLDHFIGFEQTELDDPIYRIFSMQRLLEQLSSNQNVLVRPQLWDDPFENFLLSARWRVTSDDTVRVGFKDQLYGQCWTTRRESDAMWRIYSPDTYGAKVRSTPRKLLESMWTQASYPELSCFLGKVSYVEENQFKHLLENPERLFGSVVDPNGRGQVETLLLKRPEFDHEEEVRLVLFNHDDTHTGDVWKYEADLSRVFDQIVLDPRMTEEMVKVFRIYLRHIDWPHSVSQSRLYRIPKKWLSEARPIS